MILVTSVLLYFLWEKKAFYSNKAQEKVFAVIVNLSALSVRATTRTGSFFLFGKFLLIREVMLSIFLIRTGRNFPYGKPDSYKMELKLKYGFWNFNFFLDW